MTHSPESILAGKNRPFTSTENVESLRDGREVLSPASASRT